MTLATDVEPQLAAVRITHGDGLQERAHAPLRQQAGG
jgi:hypothetical protein